MQGQGYTINLVEIHPGLLPQVRHLHELHGLLQPVVLAPLFWIGGSDPALVRIPNILAVALLALATFQLGRHHFGNFVGTIAGLLVLSWRDLALDATLGGDDVGWALFSILTFLCFFRALETRRRLWIVST